MHNRDLLLSLQNEGTDAQESQRTVTLRSYLLTWIKLEQLPPPPTTHTHATTTTFQTPHLTG